MFFEIYKKKIDKKLFITFFGEKISKHRVRTKCRAFQALQLCLRNFILKHCNFLENLAAKSKKPLFLI